MTEQQIARYRQDTAGVAHRIHFNNAGAALPPDVVTAAMRDYLAMEAQVGGYEAAEMTRASWAEFYPLLAQLLGAQPRNVAFTGSATESYNRALSSIPFHAGDTILTTSNDYVSNQIAFLQLKQRWGVAVLRAENTPTGEVCLTSLAQLLQRHRPRVVAVTHVPTNSGLVQPIEAIGQLCRQYEALYVVDACQSAGQMALDVAAIQCDFLSATFRKFMRGPRGAGFLYVSDRVLEAGFSPLFLDLHSATWPQADAFEPVADARRFETWERSYAIMLGSVAALHYALEVGLAATALRVQHLAETLRAQLEELPGLQILDKGTERCGIVTCALAGHSVVAVKAALQAQSINTSVATIGSARIDMAEKGVSEALRISPHYYNTEEEIARLLEGMRQHA